jgi:hypothetical protein
MVSGMQRFGDIQHRRKREGCDGGLGIENPKKGLSVWALDQ